MTDKYLEYYNLSFTYMSEVMKRVENRFSKEELEVLNKIMKVMDEELMPEAKIK